MIAGLVGLGLNPRCVVQIPASADRLTRLVKIIQESPFSIHDLSRVQLSGTASPFRVPRFNMPFELGLAVAICSSDANAGRQWKLMEAVPHRLNHSLSDVDGYNPVIHNGTVTGTFEALLNIFPTLRKPPLSEVGDFKWVYRKLRAFRSTLPADIFAPSPFNKLVLTATALVERCQAERH